MTRRPNILWYCTDQQRFDTIGALGNPHINTPRLDELCRRGVAFRRAYAQSPICTPSRATMLTGRYPASHHVHRNGNAYFPRGEKLVTKLFAEAGYDCGLVGKFHLSQAKGHEARQDDGYRMYQWSHHPMPDLDPEHHAYHQWLQHEKGVDPGELYGGLAGFCGAGVPAELHQTTWCTEMAIRFIREPRDGPWLLSLNPFDPHPPFDPPEAYLERYDPASLPPPLFRPSDLERQRAFAEVAQQTVEAMDPSGAMPGEQRQAGGRSSSAYAPPRSFDGRVVKAAYFAMIELIDAQFGRLLDAIAEAGQLEDTVVLFHSDHGEMLGDHGLLYKGARFFEGLVHVPMILAWRGRFLENLQSEALVELVDIAPTLLDAAGLTLPAAMQGTSVVPLLTGRGAPHVHKEHVVAEFHDALGSTARPMASHASMYFDGRYKHVVYHTEGLGELFDLTADPGEFDDLWDTASPALRYDLLRRHFDAMMATSDAGPERVSIY
jgi:arylsulfatase